MFIVCPHHIEDLLAQELSELGIRAQKGWNGVFVPQTLENMYRINYFSRLAMRVLWPLVRFKCRDKNDLYQEARNIKWDRYFSIENSFAVDANVSHPLLKNSHFAALVIKDAICDYFREKTGHRPMVQTSNPDVQINLFVQKGWATLNFDTSGAPLFKRGYRQETGDAPLQETLAAAILRLCNYSSEDVLCDPFCGSGTFLIEAAMMATQTPAGFFRKRWGFTRMPEHDEKLWEKVKSKHARIPLAKGKIFGCEKDRNVIDICKKNAEVAGFDIEVFHSRIQSFRPSTQPSFVVTNPPYGKRMQGAEVALEALSRFLHDIPKIGVLTPDLLTIPFQQKLSLFNGGLETFLYLRRIT